jgi:hypothetical protein
VREGGTGQRSPQQAVELAVEDGGGDAQELPLGVSSTIEIFIEPRREGRRRRCRGHPGHHPGVPHVFQAFAALLDEGDAALNRAARFVRDNTAQKAAA